MPIYLNKTFGLSIEEIAATMWISYLMAAAGSIIGGWFTGLLMKTKSVDTSRKIAISLGGLLVFLGFVGIIQFVGESNFMTFIYLAGVVLFGFQFAIGNIQTISSDLFRGPSVGTLAGLAGTIAAISPMIMNWFIGQITKDGAYTPAFIAITLSVILGVLSIFFFIRKIEPVRKTID
jgi:ACS family hexuronate transporter-like MFS transporter